MKKQTMEMRFTWGLILIVSFSCVTLSSCDDDDKEEVIPSPIVGAWERDVYQITDLPPGFDFYNNAILSGLYDAANALETGHSITFNQDGTYQRRIEYSGAVDLVDKGKWELDGDDLALESDTDSRNDEEFTIEGDITANVLILSTPVVYRLPPNAAMDTLTQTELANRSLVNAIINQYGEPKDVKVLLLFEK